MTDEELEQILARCNATSKGIWTSYIEGRDHESGSSFIMVGQGKDRGKDIDLYGVTEQDQDFIAHAKQDIPRLIREIKRLKPIG